MKNLALFFLALLAFVACSQEQKSPFSYRGLAFTLSTSQFVDSMQARGFAVDSAASDSGRTVVLALEKELGAWPDCPMLKDDHKIANFDATDGIISVILENTYRPTLSVRYTPKKPEK